MLNRRIEHTLLAPAAMDVAFETHLEEAVEYEFYSVCVSPYIAVPVLQAMKIHPNIKVGTVVGFPWGNIPLELKLREATYFANNGIHEIDWVLHYGEVLNEKWPNVATEMEQMARLCHDAGVVSKCIVETAYFPDQATRESLFQIAASSGVDFIKTSTGYGPAGADVEYVSFWKSLQAVSGRPLIKAAGGIRTLEQAEAFLAAGATRIGCSASVGIMEEYRKREEVKGGPDEPRTFTKGEEEA